MRRWLVFLLAVLLVLSGCDAPEIPETTLPTNLQTTQETTEPAPSLYLPGSHLETATQGAVLEFAGDGLLISMGFMGKDPVLFSFLEETETTGLVRMDVNGTVIAETVIAADVSTLYGNVGMKEDKLVYYNAHDNLCCVLDGKFQLVDTVPMPENVTDVLFSADLTTAYYSCGQEIRAMDLQTEIPRLVCQLNASEIWLDALLFEESILGAYVTDTDWNSYEAFCSAETGQLLGIDRNLISIESWDENYIVCRNDGNIPEVLLGNRDGTIRAFAPEYEYADVYALPGMNMLLELGYSDSGATAAVYSLAEGKRISSLHLKDTVTIYAPEEDPSGKYVWFVADDPERGADVLCRWEVAASEDKDDIGRIGKRATLDAPDMEGLARCRRQADALEAKYGVQILLHNEVVEPDDYSFTWEYQVKAVSNTLEELETALSRFPEDFFRTAASVCDDKTIYIHIVRQMSATTDNAPATTEALQYWLDGNAHIALSALCSVEQNFYHELSHVLDTFVYSNSIHYDFWEDNNPEGFAYDECYTEYENHFDSPWLDGEERAFIDAYSMTYAKEDRARFLEYAMMEYNWEFFAADTMQLKLKQLCMGIREAFGWEKSPDVFPWEQYLAEPLAYSEK